MLLSIKHQTDLTYSDYINESAIEVRMAPRHDTQQIRLSFNLAVGPASKVRNYLDWLGNTVHTFSINSMHNRIQIVANSVVETSKHVPNLDLVPDVWNEKQIYDWTLYDYLQFGGPVVESTLLKELAESILQASSVKGEAVKTGEIAKSMLAVINTKFVYEQGITTAASPITEILSHSRGVCQDFTHLMLGLARTLNIPARYVSGYLHPDQQKLRGFAQTHAWVELYFPTAGWVALDPTNNCVAGENFVRVAVGRNFQDVPPNKGVYKGAGAEKIEVIVHTQELDSVPLDLAQEREESINIPVFAGNIVEQLQQLRQQQEQQQQ